MLTSQSTQYLHLNDQAAILSQSISGILQKDVFRILLFKCVLIGVWNSAQRVVLTDMH